MHSKITNFWKSFTFAMAIMLGVSSYSEARVTREVAEATIPYLLEAVGIPRLPVPVEPEAADPNIARRNAIVSMLYTDAGQREMVNWAKNGVFPPSLMTDPITQNAVFVSVNTYQHNQYALQLLFPPGPGTFSSYATNVRRLGYHALHGGTPQTTCQSLFAVQANAVANVNNVLDALSSLAVTNNINLQQAQALANYLDLDIANMAHTQNQRRNQMLTSIRGVLQNNQMILDAARDLIIKQILSTANTIDTKLAIVLFVLDICDTASQIFDILDEQHAITHIAGYELPAGGIGGTRAAVIAAIEAALPNDEYNHRPISAISAINADHREGDCVQTLYRHLVNIAVQNEHLRPQNFNIEHLPNGLHGYYTVQYGPIGVAVAPTPHVVLVPAIRTESGRTALNEHDNWNIALGDLNNALGVNIGNISNGYIADIVRVLQFLENNRQRANPEQASSLLPARDANAPHNISLSAGIVVNANDTAIQNSLNALDGRGDFLDGPRFLVGSINNIRQPPNAPMNGALMVNAGQHYAYIAYLGVINIPHPQIQLLDLDWITDVIEIVDRLWNRRIVIATNNALHIQQHNTSGGHAEIIIINHVH